MKVFIVFILYYVGSAALWYLLTKNPTIETTLICGSVIAVLGVIIYLFQRNNENLKK